MQHFAVTVTDTHFGGERTKLVVLSLRELLVANERQQLATTCVSEACTLHEPTDCTVTVATNPAVQLGIGLSKIGGGKKRTNDKKERIQTRCLKRTNWLSMGTFFIFLLFSAGTSIIVQSLESCADFTFFVFCLCADALMSNL